MYQLSVAHSFLLILFVNTICWKKKSYTFPSFQNLVQLRARSWKKCWWDKKIKCNQIDQTVDHLASASRLSFLISLWLLFQSGALSVNKSHEMTHLVHLTKKETSYMHYAGACFDLLRLWLWFMTTKDHKILNTITRL